MSNLPRVVGEVINAFERLPGIGPKSAARLAFYLVNAPKEYVENLAEVFVKMKREVKICRKCFSVSENEECSICSDEKRNKKVICVVERAIDVVAFETMGNFFGVYHVLGGVINPLEHIGPEDIRIDELLGRVGEIDGEVEIIIATNPTMEGEATALYIKNKMKELGERVTVSRIGSGLPMGGDIEYADQATLSRALDGRRNI